MRRDSELGGSSAEVEAGLSPRLPVTTPSADNVQGILAFLQVVLQESQRQAIVISNMHRDLQDIVREVGVLARILRDGNDSLIVRAAVSEKSLAQCESDLKSIKASLDTRTTEDTRGKWQVWVVVAGAIFTLIGAVITATIGALVALQHHSP